MTRPAACALALLAACAPAVPEERYGFVALLGRDTVAVERVARHGDVVTAEAVDRFPRVRSRRLRVELAPDGAIRRLAMDVHTPSEPPEQRDRRVTAEVTADSVRLVKVDRAGTVSRAFATGGGAAMAHLPQSYALYELYLDAALRRAAAAGRAPGDTVQMRQFYLDREFDRFPLHRGVVRPLGGGRAEIAHDWLSGTGEATLDSARRLLRYSGARSTYQVEVRRLAEPPDVGEVAARFAEVEARGGGERALSVRDT
ncbi:hypothetical protein, partial [Roseisolibacter sp. H3M3-2]|uniref:hypothetical protein n=1 Tax=Roseisolibacter sp. H3M3-2 TaxID=3031323 RepID=UPI0023DC3FB7